MVKTWNIPIITQMSLFSDETKHYESAYLSSIASDNKSENENNRNLR